ncbi:MAG: hypothetical protein U9R79_05075 [Armatimonadota bacterium]|nr:hypothetical protein [Armatimonadota bacterium]
MQRALDYLDLEAVLSTEHAASSYGQPVLVIEGEAYGPADLLQLPQGGVMTALEWVRLAHRHREQEHRDDGPLPMPWGQMRAAPEGMRCARTDQSGDLTEQLSVLLTKDSRRALDRAAFEFKQDTGQPYSAGDVARYLLERGLKW